MLALYPRSISSNLEFYDLQSLCPSLVPRLPSFFGGYAKESAFFCIAAEKAGDEASSALQLYLGCPPGGWPSLPVAWTQLYMCRREKV